MNEFEIITSEFIPSVNAYSGAAYILPDGKYINVVNHGDIDEFIMNSDEYDSENHLENYHNGIMVDKYNCVRLNDGGNSVFKNDVYIMLPKEITDEQLYSIKYWLEKFIFGNVLVEESKTNTTATYDLRDRTPNYVINRIKRYYNGNGLVEHKEKDYE